MTELLFPSPEADERAPAGGAEGATRTGVLPSQELRDLIRRGLITAPEGIEPGQIQPASLDLRLGARAVRVRSSFLPGAERTVADRLADLRLYDIDLTDGAVLEKGCVYIVPLQEGLALRKRISALANPKSSTGRLDIFARVITDYGVEFDRVREGYRGPLYAEISPRAFSVRVRAGSRLVQLRVRRGSRAYSDTQMRRLHEAEALVAAEEPGAVAEIERGVKFTVDLAGDGPDSIIGYRAMKNTDIVDVDRVAGYDPAAFWEPVRAGEGRGLILDPDDFYILASRESVRVPRDHAAEMLAYDTLVGEFRVHYAGFFDPGFGDPELGGQGTRAVLEVRAHEVPFLIESGQVVGRLVYEPLTAEPDILYGRDIGSSYQSQRLTLGKQFRRG
ncbi:MAG: 2'-deoxycytidine 5'-triphosphate deaminase [Azospirillaceae bacterium]